MSRLVLFVGVAVVLAAMPPTASGNWSDNFDSYVPGSGMHGQGGWKGWDNDPAWDALVTDAYSHSPTNSVDIVANADLVHEYSGYDSGCWVFTAWQYVPGTFSGESYFLLLNTYNDGGPYNWSLQLEFNSVLGVVESQFEGTQLPLITDAWVEIRVEIELGADIQRVYYDGDLLTEKSWTEGASGGGALNIGAVDLFANGASSIYYDDVSLMPFGPSATEAMTWGELKAEFK